MTSLGKIYSTISEIWKFNKSSAVAKISDRSHNRHGPKRGWGAGVPPSRGELGHRLTQCGLGRGLLPYPYQAASSSIQPFGHKTWAKTGNWAPFRAELRPHLTQRRLGGGDGSPSNTMWPGPRPTCMPSFILIRPTVWPQYTNVTDRQTDSISPQKFRKMFSFVKSVVSTETFASLFAQLTVASILQFPWCQGRKGFTTARGLYEIYRMFTHTNFSFSFFRGGVNWFPDPLLSPSATRSETNRRSRWKLTLTIFISETRLCILLKLVEFASNLSYILNTVRCPYVRP